MGNDGGGVPPARGRGAAEPGVLRFGHLTVLNVAYSLAAVGPNAVGGAEQVLSLLDEGITRAGHRSVVVAQEGSQVSGTLVPVPARDGAMSYADWAHAHDHQRRAIAAALERFPVDVVHMHGVDFADYLPAADVPVLATLHLPPGRYKPAVFTLDRRGLQLQCVSPAQRRECPASPLLGPEIENGVPVARLEVREPKRGYAVALGRICPEKGFHLAIAAARSAHAPLRLAGRVFHYEDHERYFAECIVPLLDAERCYVGPVRLPEKAQLLAGARCLLVPSLVHETSGLVAMEAMAAGTPVIAFRTGALPEIIEQGVTGFLVDDAQQMAEAIAAAGDLDPEDCRAAARERFSADRMIARYLERYRQLAGA